MNMNNNFLDLVPQICEGLNWNKDENDFVTLEIQNRGLFNRIAQKVFKKPKISYVHLDELGSFVWLLIDGKTDIAKLGVLVKEHSGEKAEPLYEKLAKYFQILKSYDFVVLN
ncbi:MAG: PqqD family protein [Clostridia bacterium]|nr:PqqD family protein [Clostridia bacterium]